MGAAVMESKKMVEVEIKQNDNRTFFMSNEELLKSRLLELIEDYHWKFNSVQELEERIFGFSIRVTYGVAEYGIDMVMPKGCSGKSAAELDAMEANEKRSYNRLMRYKSEIDLLDLIGATVSFENDKMVEMYEDMLVGELRMTGIARKLNLDRKTVYRMREKILNTALQNDFVRKFLTEGMNKK